ncbi:MAG TPA: hypothetical protein VJP45_03635 [Candidatus Limnocylindria bacterium]|nr:hypothetical protein [Candidatus Limnocylindria bacterium]
MNAFRAFLFVIALLAVGFVAYQMGLSQGLATTVPAGTAPLPYYAYPHWGFGFGFGIFGLFFTLFFLFLIFAAIRAAAGGGHHGGRGWGDRRSRLEELHRELHGEKPSGDRPSSVST